MATSGCWQVESGASPTNTLSLRDTILRHTLDVHQKLFILVPASVRRRRAESVLHTRLANALQSALPTMHTALNRVQNTFGFFTTCCAIGAGMIAASSLWPFPPPSQLPSASVAVSKVEVVKGRPHYSSPIKEEYAQVRFDLNADLSGLFNWNTKQIFVYVTANYPAGAGGMSEAVIWDIIIPATESPYSMQNMKTKYWEPYMSKNKKTSRAKKSAKTPKTKELVKPGVLVLKNQKPKYHITDPSGIISERSNVTLQVSWNLQPWVGALVWDKGIFGQRVGPWPPGKEGTSKPFSFPPLKGSKPEVVKDTKPQTPQAGSASPVVNL
jgi:hypothetical protein